MSILPFLQSPSLPTLLQNQVEGSLSQFLHLYKQVKYFNSINEINSVNVFLPTVHIALPKGRDVLGKLLERLTVIHD